VAAVYDTDDLPFAVQALIPDGRVVRRAGLDRAGRADVVLNVLGHLLDPAHLV